MSYALRIAGDALSDLRLLDTHLQEDALDELELLAAQPRRLRVDRHDEAVHDFERRIEQRRHIVFIRLHRDDEHQRLTVLAVAAQVRPPVDGGT